MLGFVTPPDVSKSFKRAPKFARMMDVPEDAGTGWNSPTDPVSTPAWCPALQLVHTQQNFVHGSARRKPQVGLSMISPDDLEK